MVGANYHYETFLPRHAVCVCATAYMYVNSSGGLSNIHYSGRGKWPASVRGTSIPACRLHIRTRLLR